MKKTILMAGVLTVVLAVSNGFGAEMKLATIDMSKVMKSFNETKSAEELLAKQIEEFEAEQKDMVADRDKLRKEFEAARESAKDKALSDKEREKKMDGAEEKLNALRDCELKIRDRMNQRQKEIADQKVRMQRRIVGKLRDIIGKYAAEKKLTLVLDSASLGMSGVEMVVYSTDEMDITAGVIKIVNDGIPTPVELPAKVEKAEKSAKAGAETKPESKDLKK